MICKYKYKNQDFNSYSELLDWLGKNLKEEGIDALSDVIFSKEKQQIVLTKIDEIKSDYIPIQNTKLIDDEPGVKDQLTILEFQDTAAWGHGSPFNEVDYRQVFIKNLVENFKMTTEEALAEYRKVYTHQKRIQQDAFSLHPIYTNDSIWRSSKTALDFRESVLQQFKNQLETPIETLDQLYNDLHLRYKYSMGKLQNGERRTNVNVSCELDGLPQKIFGHIDWLFVGDDGSLHMYLFKTTDQDPHRWPDAKKERIRFQLAFLKRMLQNKGVFIKDATLNIIPVQLFYNENDKITNIKVHPTDPYSTTWKGQYAMDRYDRLVAPFISDNSIPFHISDEPIQRAIEISNKIFYSLNIKEEGISRSALTWIANATEEEYPDEPLVIKPIGDVDHAYDVIIGNKTFPVKSNKPKLKNDEILQIVKDHINEIHDNRGYYTSRLKNAIRTRFKTKRRTFDQEKGFSNSATRLETLLLGKYLSDYTLNEDGSIKEYKWELLEDLLDCNVLIFRHKDTKVIDFISLTAFDLKAQAPLAKGKSILGDYKRNNEYVDLEGTYGNIEVVKTMNLINEILPQLGNVQLGTVAALSTVGNASILPYNIGEFNKKYYSTILNTVDPSITNNFKNAQFQSVYDEILLTYNAVMNSLDNEGKIKFENYKFEDYLNAKAKDEQINALFNIANQILQGHKQYADNNQLKLEIAQGNELAILFEMVSRAYLILTGQMPQYRTSINNVELKLMTATTISDPNIQIVVNNLQATHDAISSQFLQVYDSELRNKIDDYYKEIGYTSMQNMTIGNQAQQFNNLYDQDSELMSFKNPYDNSNNLTPSERKFLKFALFQIAKIRNNQQFDYSSENDSRLPDYIKKHPEYLWVPLEKASRATSRQSKKAVVAKMKNFWRRIVNLSQNIDEMFNDVLPEERQEISGDEQNFYQMSLTNKFDLNLYNSKESPSVTLKRRKEMINKYGRGFFETNVENILIDVLAAQISTNQFQKLVIASKLLLLQLQITGNYYGNDKVVEKEIQYIQRYLKVNAFKTPVLSKAEKLIVGTIEPIKRIVTDMVLGSNVIGCFRDLTEGAQQNFISSLIKLNTDISPKSVRKAYTFVTLKQSPNAMSTMNLLNKLCLKYRISNTDVGRPYERAKTGRNGLVNYDNIMYSTLRHPDFVNRMVLFVARCIEDGVIDGDNLFDMSKHAFYIDENNNLQYDWKKDKRFSLYANKQQMGSDEYNKQKSLYLSKLRQYNNTHVDNTKEELVEPYTYQEVMTIRAVGDRIYGSYDRGKKAMNENQAEGILFGMFTTWMNGIVSTYFMAPQKNNVSRLKRVQETDEYGNKLYFNEKGEQLTLEEGGDINLPVWTDEPVIVQGIFHTVKSLISICRNDGLDEMKKYIKANPQERANMKKLLSDLFLWLITWALFKFVATPAYEEFKKDGPERSILENLIAEWTYKPASRACDQYKGVFNILTFFGEGTNLPYYSVPVQVLSETGKALFGEKSWKYLMFDNLGVTRSVRDTALAAIKSQE